MSLIPAFKIGLWNAWILTLYLPLHPLMMMLIVRVVHIFYFPPVTIRHGMVLCRSCYVHIGSDYMDGRHDKH